MALAHLAIALSPSLLISPAALATSLFLFPRFIKQIIHVHPPFSQCSPRFAALFTREAALQPSASPPNYQSAGAPEKEPVAKVFDPVPEMGFVFGHSVSHHPLLQYEMAALGSSSSHVHPINLAHRTNGKLRRKSRGEPLCMIRKLDQATEPAGLEPPSGLDESSGVDQEAVSILVQAPKEEKARKAGKHQEN
uniref:HDC17749 n=1 Tax=Drosophila melanogaster TaxID=7227 RepID=Q6IIK8_DROME|nr:TPA_inf: HDC17749 [Drosophila melanogaster]